MSQHITKELAAAGVKLMYEGTFIPLLEQGKLQGNCLCIVVMDPALSRFNSTFDNAILYYEELGEPRSTWKHPYGAIALAKTRQTWIHECDGDELRFLKPHVLVEGDTPYSGSVYRRSMAIGASGVQGRYDAMFCGNVADYLIAEGQLANDAVTKEGAINIFGQ